MKQILFLFLLAPFLAFSQNSGNFLLPDSAEIWQGWSEGEIQLDGREGKLHFVPEQFVHDFVIWPDSIPKKGETRIEPARKFYEQYPALMPIVEQREKFKFDFSPYKYTIPLAFVSGAADGVNQALLNYPKFKRVFPRANDQFWDPAISWENKYAKDKSGAVLTDYEAFPFSTTALVLVTDGHHLTRAGDHVFMFATVGFYFSDLGKKNWKQIGLDILVTSFARSAGFNTAYRIVF